MSTKKVSPGKQKKEMVRDSSPLPAELLRQYPEQYIIFSEEEGRVIGAGKTEDEALAEAQASGIRGLWHVGYSEWPNQPDR